MSTQNTNGKLYVVATPIGNLADITLRAIEILKYVDFICAEDTRRTKILLDHYKINKQLISYRDQNHNKIFPRILSLLQSGHNLSLVSDSGTPLISDPGFKLVQGLLNFKIHIIPIPGPSAAISALSISGLPTDKFSFLGFLPKTSKKRQTVLREYGQLKATLILYESPFRLKRLLRDIEQALPHRTICIAKELTKKFEEVWHGKTSKLISQLENTNIKGEIIVLIAKQGFT